MRKYESVNGNSLHACIHHLSGLLEITHCLENAPSFNIFPSSSLKIALNWNCHRWWIRELSHLTYIIHLCCRKPFAHFSSASSIVNKVWKMLSLHRRSLGKSVNTTCDIIFEVLVRNRIWIVNHLKKNHFSEKLTSCKLGKC